MGLWNGCEKKGRPFILLFALVFSESENAHHQHHHQQQQQQNRMCCSIYAKEAELPWAYFLSRCSDKAAPYTKERGGTPHCLVLPRTLAIFLSLSRWRGDFLGYFAFFLCFHRRSCPLLFEMKEEHSFWNGNGNKSVLDWGFLEKGRWFGIACFCFYGRCSLITESFLSFKMDGRKWMGKGWDKQPPEFEMGVLWTLLL